MRARVKIAINELNEKMPFRTDECPHELDREQNLKICTITSNKYVDMCIYIEAYGMLNAYGTFYTHYTMHHHGARTDLECAMGLRVQRERGRTSL